MDIVGRAQELALLDAGIVAARSATSTVTGLRGAAGTGKTSLLDGAAKRATGFTILRVDGAENDADVAFGALLTLLRSCTSVFDGLPSPQRQALRSALALGPPTMPDRLAVGAAVLQCLALLAEEQPVLVLIDDMQWIDAASAAAILFALRRLRADRVFALLAWRDEVGESHHDNGQRSFDLDSRLLSVHTLEPLSHRESVVLLTQQGSFAPEVADQLAGRCAGNPLTLFEVAAQLNERQRRGLEPLSPWLPVGRASEDLYRRSLEALSGEERLCLLIAALVETHSATLINGACALAGIVRPDWREAERRRLVTIGADRIDFTHPLARGATVQLADPAQRRAAHLAIAGVHEPGEAQVWHRALGTVDPDEETAAALEAVSLAALGRGDSTSAARAAERSALLTPSPDTAARRWLLAAQTSVAAGLDFSTQLDRAAHDGDEATRSEATILRAAIAAWNGDTRTSELIFNGVPELEQRDRMAAAITMAFAASMAWNRLDVENAARIAGRAWDLADHRLDLPHRFGLMPALGYAICNSLFGSGADGLIDECQERIETLAIAELAAPVSLALLVGGRAQDSLAFSERMHQRATDAGSVTSAAWTATACGIASHRLGDLHVATRWLQQGHELAQLANPFAYAHACAELAQIAALQGDVSGCRALIAQAESVIERAGNEHTVASVRFAAMLAAIASGSHDDALRIGRALVHPHLWLHAAVPAIYELVELLVQVGRHDEALELLPRLQPIADSKLLDNVGQVERCLGLLADDDHFAEHFERSLALLRSGGCRLELAKTQLVYGERLRRISARAAAREQLRAALAVYEAEGCVPLAERATRELRASGASLAAPLTTPGTELTPQEAQVAHAVASGRTNRDVATLLFISPRTVEMHLTNVYRKLGVRTRTELAARFNAAGRAGNAASPS